jgi:hypothetical protein
MTTRLHRKLFSICFFLFGQVMVFTSLYRNEAVLMVVFYPTISIKGYRITDLFSHGIFNISWNHADCLWLSVRRWFSDGSAQVWPGSSGCTVFSPNSTFFALLSGSLGDFPWHPPGYTGLTLMFFSVLFPGQGERAVFNQGIFHPLDCRADRAFTDPIFRHLRSIVRYFRKYFRVLYRLSSAVNLGGLPPFLCNASNSFWRIKSMVWNVSGLTPYNSLKRTAWAFAAFFPFPCHHYIILAIIKQV